MIPLWLCLCGGISGRWRRFTLIDVHPFDTTAIERGLRAYILGDVNR